jgi:hypothetical protein
MMWIYLFISSILANCIEQSCIYGNADGQGNVIITVHSSNSAWAGIGVGSSMANAVMVIGFKNGASYTLSDRTSRSRALPTVADTQASTLVPLAVPAPSWATIAFSFRRPIASLGITKDSSYIFASGTGVTTPSDPRSFFSPHGVDHVFGALDFTATVTSTSTTGGSGGNNGTRTTAPTPGRTSPATAPTGETKSILNLPSNFSYTTLLLVHGYLLLFAWVLCPFVGIFIARFMKAKLGHWWYRLHLMVMIFGAGLFSIAGALLVYLYKDGPHFSTEYSLHPLLGLIVTILMILQFVLGFVSDYLFDEDRTSIPWWDVLHWWFGRLLTIFAIATIVLGIRYYESFFGDSGLTLYITLAVMGSFGVLLMVYGQFSFGTTHHVKEKSN